MKLFQVRQLQRGRNDRKGGINNLNGGRNNRTMVAAGLQSSQPTVAKVHTSLNKKNQNNRFFYFKIL